MKILSKWSKLNFTIDFFNKQTKADKIELIYFVLSSFKIDDKSKDKINSIIAYMASPNKNKKYRVGNNIYFVKTKNNLLFECKK